VQRIPVTGQLTFVPQSFFDQQAEAHAKTARFFRDFAQRYAKSLEIPRRPGNPEPGWLGVEPQVFSLDPVLRQFHLMSSTSPQDLRNFAEIASRVPAAAKILRQLLADANLPQSAISGIFERPRRRPRILPREAEAT
jgi:hypothetical protein